MPTRKLSSLGSSRRQPSTTVPPRLSSTPRTHSSARKRFKEVALSVKSRVGFADDQVPLTVVLPPVCSDNNGTNKLFMMDNSLNEKVSKDKLAAVDSETTDNNNEGPQLNVEEFECGVSVAGSDRQEWSFTLYDFDGRGNITKEDLGQLLKSLYDAVGSSISLPQTGTKTLKLRLTVSPDKSAKVMPELTPCPKPNNQTPTKNNHGNSPQTKLNKERDNSKLTRQNLKQNNLNHAAACNNLNQTGVVSKFDSHRHNLTSAETCDNKEAKNTNLVSVYSEGAAAPNAKTRLSSSEKRHLVDLVKANMERHKQHVRRHPGDSHSPRRSRRHHRHSKENDATPAACKESQERRNYYLDLAGVDNDEISPAAHNTTAPGELPSTAGPAPGALMSTSMPNPIRDYRSHDHPKVRQRSQSANIDYKPIHGHMRSQSYDLSGGIDMTGGVIGEVVDCVREVDERLKDIERLVEDEPDEVEVQLPQPKPVALKGLSNKGVRPFSLPAHLPDTVSPHHHRRHRNRERNRRRAMQQVAEWIEREHSFTCGGEHVIVQKHEHHHVHEHHHHHHYHHYPQT